MFELQLHSISCLNTMSISFCAIYCTLSRRGRRGKNSRRCSPVFVEPGCMRSRLWIGPSPQWTGPEMCRTWRSLLFYDFEIGRAPITHDVLVFIRPVPILLRNVLQLILKNVYKCGMTHDTCAIPKNRHQINDMINIRNAIHTRQFLRQRISCMVLIQYRPTINPIYPIQRYQPIS